MAPHGKSIMGHSAILPWFGDSLWRVFGKDFTREVMNAGLQILDAAPSRSRLNQLMDLGAELSDPAVESAT